MFVSLKACRTREQLAELIVTRGCWREEVPHVAVPLVPFFMARENKSYQNLSAHRRNLLMPTDFVQVNFYNKSI